MLGIRLLDCTGSIYLVEYLVTDLKICAIVVGYCPVLSKNDFHNIMKCLVMYLKKQERYEYHCFLGDFKVIW